MQCVQHTAIHRGSRAMMREHCREEERERWGEGTASRVGQMLLFLAFVKSSKTFFPNTWHRPLILWVWGRMKASEGGRKEVGEINGEKTLLGVVWICFTPCCLDCFLFLHTAATKQRIPIGRHGNARQQHGNKHFLPGLRGKNALVHSATGGNDDSRKAYKLKTPGSLLLLRKHTGCLQYTRVINQSAYYIWKWWCRASGSAGGCVMLSPLNQNFNSAVTVSVCVH